MTHPKRGTTTRISWPSAIAENFYERASDDPAEPQLWVYTDAWSYAPGDVVRLHVSTSLARYDLEIWRDGAQRETVLRRGGLPGALHAAPDDCSVRGCGWPVALEVPAPAEWRSGGYVITLRGAHESGQLVTAQHLFLLRAAPGAEAPMVQICATGTWLAYNDWGGSNHYEGITGPGRDAFSPRVSILRPFSRGFVTLPVGAPRAVLREPPPIGAAHRYPHIDWAYANGHSKKYASAGWASYDRHFARWAESAGYPCDLCAQHDLAADPALLERYQVAVIVGHDEYWSAEMRDAVDRFVDRGGRLARFAGNITWQTRIEDAGRTQVCYKYRARAEDPAYADPAERRRTTTAWEAVEVGRPGAETFGVNGLRGVYAGWGGAAPRQSGGFTVYRPDHWALAGADVFYGDVLGAEARVFGYEVDGLDYTIQNGLPVALGGDGAPEGVEIIAMGLATLLEEDHDGTQSGDAGGIGDADLIFAAEAIHGEATPETLAKRRYGSGMIVYFERGEGAVFTAGTCDWVVGLCDGAKDVSIVTQTVLDRFLSVSGN